MNTKLINEIRLVIIAFLVGVTITIGITTLLSEESHIGKYNFETSNKITKDSITINEFVNYHFNYTYDNCKNANDFNKLLTEGGNCCSWSNYYWKKMKEIGYNAKKETIFWTNKTDELEGHMFVITWDNEGKYCILDQKKLIGCN